MRERSKGDPVLREYAHLAEHYDQRWSFYIRATIQETLKRLNPYPGDRILDVGCGTGVLLELLSRTLPQAQLFGVDPSAEMLAVARRRLKSSISLHQGCAECLPFTSAAFDIVVSTSTLHYFRNPHQALLECGRVLKPQGRFVITDWCNDYLFCWLCDRFLRWFNRAHFRAYNHKECRELLAIAGFRSIMIDRYKINWLWGLMTASAEKPTGTTDMLF